MVVPKSYIYALTVSDVRPPTLFRNCAVCEQRWRTRSVEITPVCPNLAFSPYIGPVLLKRDSHGFRTGAMQISGTHFVGVDVGGTKVSAGLVDSNGKITRQTRTPMVTT